MLKKLSLVIPYYNDEGCAHPFVTELKTELDGLDYDLILVDDGSKDGTPQELDRLEGEHVQVVHNEINLDYGGAIQTGLRAAGGDIIGFTCGDGEVSPEDIARVFRRMEDWDVVKAVREKRSDGLLRTIITKVFNLFNAFRFGLGLKDVNGYPVYFKREVYETLSELRNDWLFNLDLYRKMRKKNYKILEVAVGHGPRLCGKSHMTPRRILKMVWHYFFYK